MSVKLKQLLGKARNAYAAKDYARAGALFEEAVTLKPQSHQAWFGLGQVALAIGQADTATTFLTHASELHPKDADILCSLAGAHVKTGNWQRAKTALQTVIHLPHPQSAHYCLLGLACQSLGELDDALAAFKKATLLAPRYPDAWLSLGHLYLEKKQLDDTNDCLQKLNKLAPQTTGALDLAGDLAWVKGDTREAASFFRQAADSAPDQAKIQAKLAICLIMCGEALAAIDALERAHKLGIAEDWILEKLGIMFVGKYWTPMARENLEMAVERNPDNLDAWGTLLMVYAKSGDSEKVRKAADTLLKKDPDNLHALMNLATWHTDQGRHDEALALLARAREKAPEHRAVYSKALWALLSASSAHAADILELAQTMDEIIFRPLRRANDFAALGRDPERRLRIGWLSSDMRQHPVSAFVLPFLQHIDHDKLETVIYYNFSEEDDITRKTKRCVDKWRVVVGIGDDALADLIQGDEIDILVDLNGFTDGCRSDVVARKPAPIQVTWLGFPGTSGMTAMDYILIPPDPVLEKGGWCSETPWPLPDCYGARTHISDAALLPGLPCERAQAQTPAPFTFACLNHFRKASEKTIELWSHILLQVPDARLILVAIGGKDGDTIRYFSSQFEKHGVDPRQLAFRGYVPTQQYFESYNEIDLALDPFPYNGGTTSFDSIWMGVPFVTWPGEHLCARMGKTILENVGLHELVADSPDAYVDIAVRLAHDREHLKALRVGLRERMLASPLLDAPRMARSLESAFRGMWHRWCETP